LATSYTDNSTAASGTAGFAVFNSFDTPTLLATNATVTTTNAATVYISAAPAAGANMTITNAYALYVSVGTSYFGGDLNIAGTTFGLTQANYLSSITPGTASASKALVLDGSSNITTGINSLSMTTLVLGGTTLGGTEAGYLSSITPGTASASKALVLNGSSNITGVGSVGAQAIAISGNRSSAAWGSSGIQSQFSGSTHTNTSTAASGSVTLATFNSFGQPTLSATNTGVTTITAATVYIDNAPATGTNMTINLPYALYIAQGNSFFGGSTNATNNSTGGISTSGGLGVAKDVYIGSTSTASKLTLATNDTTLGGTFTITGGTSSAVNVQLQFNATSGFWGTQSNHSFSIMTNNNARVAITNAGLVTINSTTDATSASSGGAFTSLGGAGVAKSLYVGIDTKTTRNTISSGAGVHSYGFDLTGLNTYGGGAHMHYALSTASFFGYNYNTSAYTAAAFNNALFITAGGLCGIGGTASYPFEIVSGAVNATLTNCYAISGQTLANVSNTGSVGISFKVSSGRAWFATEVNFTSDRRIKKDIDPLTNTFAKTFVQSCTPVQYRYKTQEDTKYQFGFIAQDLIKCNYGDLVNCDYQEGMVEETDDDGFFSPPDHVLNVSYTNMIAILAQSQKDIYATIDMHETTIATQAQQINDLEARLAKLEALLQ